MTSTALGRALRALSSGDNVSQSLSEEGYLPLSDASLIELMYEVQSGSYTEASERANPARDAFLSEIVALLRERIGPDASLLDVGTGEATTLVPVLSALRHVGDVKAIDISWSRLSWAKRNADRSGTRASFAVADLAALPLADRSVDYVISTHALEPNGGRELELLRELARVARCGMVLMEPDWDSAGAQQRQRMKSLGYIGSMSDAAAAAGVQLDEVIPFNNSLNPLNVSTAFVFSLDSAANGSGTSDWVDPTEHQPLEPFGGGLRTAVGQWFPTLADIPFLRPSDALLAARPAPDLGL